MYCGQQKCYKNTKRFSIKIGGIIIMNIALTQSTISMIFVILPSEYTVLMFAIMLPVINLPIYICFADLLLKDNAILSETQSLSILHIRNFIKHI